MLPRIKNLFKTISFVITKAISKPVRTPFQNIKSLVVLNKILGLISCKLTNGQFQQSTIWSRCFCALWILIHCAYFCVYMYEHFFATSPAEKAEKDFTLNFVRFNVFILSLIPYNYVAIFHYKEFVKFSEKLEEYDDRAKALRHERKDKNVFIWLYFVYTFGTITVKSYFVLKTAIREGTTETILRVIFYIVIPIVCGTYCVFITVIFLDLTRQRFRHLNEEIIPYVSQLSITRSWGEITIYDVRYLHGVLIDSAKLLDSLYGIGTLFTFGSVLLESIANIYMFVTVVQEDAIVSSLDLLFQALYLFAMYHFTTYEANRVEERVIQYAFLSRNEKCRLDRIEMMLYFYHKRFSFSAAGFFILDLTILLSIISTVATYITLLV